MNYYNEFDPHMAAWLRQLIADGLIPPGDVDQRSITYVKPADLLGYTQCHFFAGIGGWPLALALAGWPANRPVWTGSCPCQPFSLAGKGKGQADERHLWPAFFNLIRECRPDTVFGEQVEGAIAHGWLDGIRADLEGEGYACGDATLGAHSVGSPHQRQRLYWVADSCCSRAGGNAGAAPGKEEKVCGAGDSDGMHFGNPSFASSAIRRVADAQDKGPSRAGTDLHIKRAIVDGTDGRMGDTGRQRDERRREAGNLGCPANEEQSQAREREWGGDANSGASFDHWTSENGPVGFWSDSVWIPCRDGKHRRIPAQSLLQFVADGVPCIVGDGRLPGFTEDEARTIRQAAYGFPLCPKIPHRPQLLKGAGNAIVPQVAAHFVTAFLQK